MQFCLALIPQTATGCHLNPFKKKLRENVYISLCVTPSQNYTHHKKIVKIIKRFD